MADTQALETKMVGITVRNARTVDAPILFALADVDIDIDGIIISILGVQARRLAAGGTEVVLPRMRKADGSWVSAISLPADLGESLISAVLLYLTEEGLAHNRLLRSEPGRPYVGWP